MKRSFLLSLAFLALSSSAFADHDLGNVAAMDHRGYCDATAAANYAYNLADLGEVYARSSHRHLRNAGRSLHEWATNLYHSLIYTGYYGVQQFSNLEYATNVFADRAPAQAAYQAKSLFAALRNSLYCY